MANQGVIILHFDHVGSTAKELDTVTLFKIPDQMFLMLPVNSPLPFVPWIRLLLLCPIDSV